MIVIYHVLVAILIEIFLSCTRLCHRQNYSAFFISVSILFSYFIICSVVKSKFCLVSDKIVDNIVDEITMCFSLLSFQKSRYFTPLVVENVLRVYFLLSYPFILYNDGNFHAPPYQRAKYPYIVLVQYFQLPKHLYIGLPKKLDKERASDSHNYLDQVVQTI